MCNFHIVFMNKSRTTHVDATGILDYTGGNGMKFAHGWEPRSGSIHDPASVSAIETAKNW